MYFILPRQVLHHPGRDNTQHLPNLPGVVQLLDPPGPLLGVSGVLVHLSEQTHLLGYLYVFPHSITRVSHCFPVRTSYLARHLGHSQSHTPL